MSGSLDSLGLGPIDEMTYGTMKRQEARIAELESEFSLSQAERRRLRGALEFYADEGNYDDPHGQPTYHRAREALSSIPEGERR